MCIIVAPEAVEPLDLYLATKLATLVDLYNWYFPSVKVSPPLSARIAQLVWIETPPTALMLVETRELSVTSPHAMSMVL